MPSNIKKTKATITLLLILSFILLTVTVPYALATEDSWVSKAPMQQARGRLGVAVVNGKIYAIGGVVDPPSWGQSMGTNEEYDPASDTWIFKAEMPTSRASFGIVVYQNKIYCIGGYTGIDNAQYVLSRANEVYDPATNTWETKTSMPTPRMGVVANFVSGKIYMIGGNSNENLLYDPETDSWTNKMPMPITPILYGSWSCASAVVDDKIHVMGFEYEDFHQIYDPTTDSWSLGTPNVPAYATLGATTGIMAPKRIYVFGVGSKWWDLAPPSFKNLVYNPENDNWTVGTSMTTGRIHVGVAVVNDTFYVIGGYIPIIGNNVDVSAVNEQYTPVGYIPEFPSWAILPLLLVATLAAIICKKRLPNHFRESY